MRRTYLSIAALVAFVGGTALSVAPPAIAQTGYPPTCNVADIPVNAGSHNVGDTFTVTLPPSCTFTAGASVTVTVNGQSVPNKVANASGSVTVRITVVSATQLSIDDPVLVGARCGVNTAVATGPSGVAGTNVTQTANFTLSCPGVPGGRVTPVTGSVAFTGANVAKWAAVALALILFGAVLVFLNRRRSHTES